MKNVLNKISEFLSEIGKSILVFFGYLTVTIFLSSLYQRLIQSKNFWYTNLSALLIELIVMFILLLIYNKKVINDFKEFKKNYKSIMDITFKNWLIGLIIMVISNIIISILVGNIASNEELNRSLLLSTPLYAIGAMVFVAPITEELIFRLSPRKAFKRKIPYLIYSALFFASMHLLSSSSLIELLYVIPYGALGFSFAKSYYETDNICSSITIHMIHNTIAVIFAYMALLG